MGFCIVNLLEFDALIWLKRSGKVSSKASYVVDLGALEVPSDFAPTHTTRVETPPKNIGSSSFVEDLRRPFRESCIGKWCSCSGDTRP